MKTTITLRNKGLDELIRIKTGHSRGHDIKKRAPRRMNMPVFATFDTFEEADASTEVGFVYAIRTSKPGSGIFHGIFGLRYVKIPVKDPSLARHSYLAWVKEVNTPLQINIRYIDHMEICGTPFYEIHVSAKLIK